MASFSSNGGASTTKKIAITLSSLHPIKVGYLWVNEFFLVKIAIPTKELSPSGLLEERSPRLKMKVEKLLVT